MSEIWNLSALCRCCHTDGNFKSLQLPYKRDDNTETFAVLLHKTFGINIQPPPFEASYTICEACIAHLLDAAMFKQQVLSCEEKFDEYCKNEQATTIDIEVKIKEEFPEDGANPDHGYSDLDDKCEDDLKDNKNNVILDNKEENNEFKCFEKINSTVEIKVEDTVPKKQIEISIDALHVPVKATSVPKKRTITSLKATSVQKKRTITKKSVKVRAKIKKTDPTLEVHVKTDTGEIYSCKLCGGSYELLKKLQRHIYEKHLYQTFKCEHCPKKFTSDLLFKRHVKTHGRETRFKCTYCVKDFSTKYSLMEHQNSHTKEKVYKCDLCQKELKHKSTLIKHLRWHNGTNKKCICDTCGHSFNDLTNLRKHVMAVHEKLRPFCCEECPKTFSAKKHLVAHVRMHNGEKPYQCNVCTKTFSRYDHMKKHKLIHEGSDFVYTCVVCKNTYKDRGRFRSHVRSHSGNLPHKCPLCNKDFSCKYSMKRHVSEHYGLKPHHCEICQKRFTQKTQLNRHIKNLHNPGKVKGVKVKCDLCKMNVYDLEKHRKSHFDRPHKCELCEKSYSERNALNRHINSIHLGRKRHECKVCGKKYTNAGSLKNHKVKIHKLVLKKEMEENFDNVLTAFTIQNSEAHIDEN